MLLWINRAVGSILCFLLQGVIWEDEEREGAFDLDGAYHARLPGASTAVDLRLDSQTAAQIDAVLIETAEKRAIAAQLPRIESYYQSISDI